MTAELAIANRANETALGFPAEKVELLKRTICRGATNDELELFIHACRRTGLDPFMKQIHAVKRYDRNQSREVMSIQTGIDGYRLIADRTGQYAGNDDPVFEGGDDRYPAIAKVTVYKLVGGQPRAFSASARWSEYYPGERQGFMWNKMPHVMLGKVAESLALRKAFPAELSGVYTTEEMDQGNAPPAEPQDKQDDASVADEHDAAVAYRTLPTGEPDLAHMPTFTVEFGTVVKNRGLDAEEARMWLEKKEFTSGKPVSTWHARQRANFLNKLDRGDYDAEIRGDPEPQEPAAGDAEIDTWPKFMNAYAQASSKLDIDAPVAMEALDKYLKSSGHKGKRENVAMHLRQALMEALRRDEFDFAAGEIQIKEGAADGAG